MLAQIQCCTYEETCAGSGMRHRQVWDEPWSLQKPGGPAQAQMGDLQDIQELPLPAF